MGLRFGQKHLVRTRAVLRKFIRDYKGTAVLITVEKDTVESTYLHPFWVVRGADLANRPIPDGMVKAPEGCTTPGRWVFAGDVRVGDDFIIARRKNIARRGD